MSQADLAEKMGAPFHPQTVHRIERGQRQVGVGEAAALAEIFGISLAELTWPDPVSSTVAWLDLFTGRADQAFEQIAAGTRDSLFAAAQIRHGIKDATASGAAEEDDVREAVAAAVARLENATPEKAVQRGADAYADWAGDDGDVPPSWVNDGLRQVPMPPWEAPSWQE